MSRAPAKKPISAAQGRGAEVAEPDFLPQSDEVVRIELPGFEGPLDLLLHLIQEHELDILDIPIAFVTSKYLEHIQLMQELNIDVAAEYLVMAATLAHIKSRMLLPVPPADLEDGEEVELDPRAELVRRLLEYQKYKKAAEELAQRSVLGRDVFLRPPPKSEDPLTAPLMPGVPTKLLEAFQRVLARAKIVLDHEIQFERLSINDRINQLVDLIGQRKRLDFEELFEGQRTKSELIVTFLAILELTRLKMIHVFQESALASITIELAVSDEDLAGVNGLRTALEDVVAAVDDPLTEPSTADAAKPAESMGPQPGADEPGVE